MTLPPLRRHDGSDREAYALNQAYWDEITPVHADSEFYGVDRFLAGESTLQPFVVEEVGDVAGLSLLHLQCHFGMDTLSWARLGAHVTGVDFSGESIARARALAERTGIDATFVHSNIFDVAGRFDGRFDRVFTSFGALCWLADLKSWGELIARSLKPGGVFYIADFHPFQDMLTDRHPIRRTEDIQLLYPYFGGGEGLRFDPEGEDDGDYADPDFQSERSTVEWYHPVSETIGALTGAGLYVESFNEYPFTVYRAREGMERGDDGYWRFPPEVMPLPLIFTLRARKPPA